MVEGKGTKAVLSILIVVIFVTVVCYFVYEKKSRDNLKSSSNYLLPNLFKLNMGRPNDLDDLSNLDNLTNLNNVVSEEEEVEEQSSNIPNVEVEEESDDAILESFTSDIPTKKENYSNKCIGKRDLFLLNQNNYYSSCDNDCINTNLVLKYDNQF